MRATYSNSRTAMSLRPISLALLLAARTLQTTFARDWTQYVSVTEILARDGSLPAYAGAGNETDPFYFTASPSSAPSSSPTVSAMPSSMPSVHPSDVPTASPSDVPSGAPSASPTSSPSFSPSDVPTHSPSVIPSSSPTNIPSNAPITPTPKPTGFPTNPVPNNFPSTYFDYRENSNKGRGPDKWHKVKVDASTNNYWHEFDLFSSTRNNHCGGDMQSPIDLCVPTGHCIEHHEFRPRPGDYKMDSGNITKQILPNKLRLYMKRRTGDEPDPPYVDFAKAGAGHSDMKSIDIKFPSEHTICGERFDGEMQYWHLHPYRRHFITVSWFLDGSPGNPHNRHMQKAIDEFRKVFDLDDAECQRRQRRARALFEERILGKGGKEKASLRGGSLEDSTSRTTTAETPTVDESSFGGMSVTAMFSKIFSRILTSDPEHDQNMRRLALRWDPYHEDIQRTIHFWAYEGSITEPPCSKGVAWRVMDVPVLITPEQLSEMQNILFNYRDPKKGCKMTSTHRNGSVARPIQKKLPNYKCSRQDYKSDEERQKCGNLGCKPKEGGPYGRNLDPWYPPIAEVTAPPSKSPTLQ